MPRSGERVIRGRQIPEGQQLTHTQPRSGSLNSPWDQTTLTLAVLMAATPVAKRRMGFKTPRARRNEGVSRPTWFPMDESGGAVTDAR